MLPYLLYGLVRVYVNVGLYFCWCNFLEIDELELLACPEDFWLVYIIFEHTRFMINDCEV